MANLDTERFPQKELADVLGVTVSTIQTLSKQGVLTNLGVGKYKLKDAVQAYLEYKLSASSQKDIVEARKAVLVERHRQLKLKNDDSEADLLPAGEVEELFDAALISFRGQIEGVPGRLAQELAGISEPALVRARLQEELRRALALIADQFDGPKAQGKGGKATPATTTKKRRSMGGRKPNTAAGKRGTRSVS